MIGLKHIAKGALVFILKILVVFVISFSDQIMEEYAAFTGHSLELFAEGEVEENTEDTNGDEKEYDTLIETVDYSFLQKVASLESWLKGSVNRYQSIFLPPPEPAC